MQLDHSAQALQDIGSAVKQALEEDIGSGDISAELCPKTEQRATIITREDMVLCGQVWVDAVFTQLDEQITIDWHHNDGDMINKDSVICSLQGPAPTLLTGERTALNFLQTLSATATQTKCYVEKIATTKTQILDTRKTIPNLRYAQKYAVRCGGGYNHRMGLYDAYLIKENHITAAGSIANAIKAARQQNAEVKLEVEVENIEQLQETIEHQADAALLDNFSLSQIEQAVTLANKKIKLEASGGITLETILAIAETGIDYISVGALTKDIQAIDLSMRFLD